MIYLDNSATTYPKPSEVRQRVDEALRSYGANPGRGAFPMSMRTAEAVYQVRSLAADFFHAPGPECVSFQPSCTQALNTVIQSLSPGDHVVTTELEHNAVLRPLHAMKKRGVTYTVVPVEPGDNDAVLDAFRRAFRENTRLLICTHASNVWGVRLPVERLAALAHIYGAAICVDAAQSAGVLPIDLAESGIDYLCCAGHKGLYGPMGTGMLLTPHADRLRALVQGGTGTHAADPAQPREMPEFLESGTQNVPGILGLGAGIAFVRKKTPERIRNWEMRHIGRIYEGLAALPGVRLYTPYPDAAHFAPVLSFNVEGLPSETAGDLLAKRGIAVRCGLHCAPLAHKKFGTEETGAVRVSPSAFTSDRDVDAFLAAVREIRPR